MKRLLVLRHAKSERGPEFGSDYERPLAKRGKRDAASLGEALAERGLVPDVVVSSPARRARQTARRACRAAGLKRGEIVYHDSLYFEGAGGAIQAIRETAGAADVVMVVGHNPTLEEIVAYLTRHYVSLPTATMAVIDFDVADWSDIKRSTGALRTVLSPKDLGTARDD